MGTDCGYSGVALLSVLTRVASALVIFVVGSPRGSCGRESYVWILGMKRKLALHESDTRAIRRRGAGRYQRWSRATQRIHSSKIGERRRESGARKQGMAGDVREVQERRRRGDESEGEGVRE